MPGQFFNGVLQVWILSFLSLCLVVCLRQKRTQSALLFTLSWEEKCIHIFSKGLRTKVKYKQLWLEFELCSVCLFPKTLTHTLPRDFRYLSYSIIICIHRVIWSQVFLSNTYNLQTIICFQVEIYIAFCLDLAQGRINGAPKETWIH